jgi:hypothetical protein
VENGKWKIENKKEALNGPEKNDIKEAVSITRDGLFLLN